jgi:hypothetical protein
VPHADKSSSLQRTDPRDWITPEHLNVAPALLGAPLARPRRRLVAIAIDVMVVALVSDLGNVWLVAGAGLAVLLWLRRASADSAARRWVGGVASALLIGGGIWQFALAPHELPHPGHKRAEDAEELAEAIKTSGPEGAQALHIAHLEAELAEARAPKAIDLKQRLQDWSEDVGLGLTWAVVYFSLLPVWWQGQTIGKKLLGLRVVELTGKPLTVLRAFGRYGGYAAGMATGGFGFAQVWWDPNRQAIQDKTAHTVVIDLRRPAGPVRTLRPPSAEGSVIAAPPTSAIHSPDETPR